MFGRITDINHPEEYDIDKVLDIIKTDNYYHVAGKVDAVRKAKTKEEKEKAKMKLPAVTWNGTFKTKNRSDLIHYSSFTALDFDHIQPEKMDEFGNGYKDFHVSMPIISLQAVMVIKRSFFMITMSRFTIMTCIISS